MSSASAGRPLKLQLRKVFKAFDGTTVLDGIDLDVAQGDVITLIGASGSGKSTLLRCCNLLEPVDDGELLLDGVDIAEPGLDPDPVRRRIGMVFQSFNLFPHLSAIENVKLAPMHVRHISDKEATERGMALLEKVGVADKADAFPEQLSGGQQQRVAIARALAMQPQIMFFDEPTSALDPEMIGEVLDVMRTMAKEGMTMIVVSHEMGFIKEAATRVLFLADGAIVEEGSPDQIFNDSQHQRTQEFLSKIL